VDSLSSESLSESSLNSTFLMVAGCAGTFLGAEAFAGISYMII
jgi:hypothetical protein